METDIYQAPNSNLSNEEKPVSHPIASGGKRFLNYLIDTAVLYAFLIGLAFAYGMIIGLSEQSNLDDLENSNEETIFALIVYGIYFLYPIIMEACWGRTVGKFCTRTKVVNLQDGKASFGQALARTLCRLIPFDHFSFLGSQPRGWHDTIPKTKVVDTSKPAITQATFSRVALDPNKGVPIQKTPASPR